MTVKWFAEINHFTELRIYALTGVPYFLCMGFAAFGSENTFFTIGKCVGKNKNK